MLFEYAVEPQAMGSSWQNFLYLIEKFGFDRGRLISRFPTKWEKKVIQAARDAGVSQVRLASMVERLRNTKLRVADFGRAYDVEVSWTDNALAEHLRTPFYAIIARQASANCTAMISISDLDEDHALMRMAQDRSVIREAPVIVDALSGLLRVSGRVVFVDPFFDPYNGRYKKTIRECLVFLVAMNPRASCEIHYRYHENKPSNRELERDAAFLFGDIIPDGGAVRIYCWKEKAGGADFHARYLLTDRGGIGIDAGFSAEGTHQTTDMHLMSIQLAQTRLDAFTQGATDFELVQPILEVLSDGSVRHI